MKVGFNQNQSLGKLNALNVIKYDTLGRTVLIRNIRKKRKPLLLNILLMKGKFFMILKVFSLCLLIA
jgi:hypothetical protein